MAENIAKKVTELVGHTPLLELTNTEKKYDLKARILAKVEYFNPAGSVKDRQSYSGFCYYRANQRKHWNWACDGCCKLWASCNSDDA